MNLYNTHVCNGADMTWAILCEDLVSTRNLILPYGDVFFPFTIPLSSYCHLLFSVDTNYPQLFEAFLPDHWCPVSLRWPRLMAFYTRNVSFAAIYSLSIVMRAHLKQLKAQQLEAVEFRGAVKRKQCLRIYTYVVSQLNWTQTHATIYIMLYMQHICRLKASVKHTLLLGQPPMYPLSQLLPVCQICLFCVYSKTNFYLMQCTVYSVLFADTCPWFISKPHWPSQYYIGRIHHPALQNWKYFAYRILSDTGEKKDERYNNCIKK